MNKEEIYNLLNCSKCKLKECIGCDITYTDREKIRKYIEQLETKIEVLNNTNRNSNKENQEIFDITMELIQEKSDLETKVKELEEREKQVKEFLERGIEDRHWKYYDEVSHTQHELDRQAEEILNLLKKEGNENV